MFIKFLKPKIGNREKHQERNRKYPKKLVKHEEAYRKWGERYKELPLDGFLNHLVTSFEAASQIPRYPVGSSSIFLFFSRTWYLIQNLP